jgi:hypothetical protein
MASLSSACREAGLMSIAVQDFRLEGLGPSAVWASASLVAFAQLPLIGIINPSGKATTTISAIASATRCGRQPSTQSCEGCVEGLAKIMRRHLLHRSVLKSEFDAVYSDRNFQSPSKTSLVGLTDHS